MINSVIKLAAIALAATAITASAAVAQVKLPQTITMNASSSIETVEKAAFTICRF